MKGIVERVVNTNPEYIPEILTSDLLNKDTVKYCIDKTIEVSPIHILNIYQENSNCSQLIDTEKFYNSINDFMYVDSKYALSILNNENSLNILGVVKHNALCDSFRNIYPHMANELKNNSRQLIEDLENRFNNLDFSKDKRLENIKE